MKKFKEENYEERFENLVLSEEFIEKRRFVKCHFINCNFENIKFISCKFNECLFDKCILINLNISQTVLDEVEFKECKVFTINFSEIRNFNTKLKFLKSKIHYCLFNDLELLNFQSINSEFYETDFQNTKLEGSIWEETSLNRTNFFKCYLKKADFSTAKDYLISAKDNYLNKTKFSYPNLIRSLEFIGMEVE